MARPLLLVSLCVTLWSCGGDDTTPAPPKVHVTPAPEGAPWQLLSEWNLFSDGPSQSPAERVLPYDVISPLWSDETLKHRFMHVPEGQLIGYEDTERWKFPVGTVLVKSFAYPVDARDPALGEQLLETRLLVRESGGWTAHTYVWDPGQSDAERKVAGATFNASWIDEQGAQRTHTYLVPNTNRCGECHGTADPDTLGGRTRQLDRDFAYAEGTRNQIDHLAQLGWLSSQPPDARIALVAPFGDAPLPDRARSYLDANCAHCHAPGGGAASSGLLLDWVATEPGQPEVNFGVCKVPTSAGGATCGLTHDIVPGNPDQSILVCRMESRDPSIQMPPLATGLVDPQGSALIRQWIAGLPPAACQ